MRIYPRSILAFVRELFRPTPPPVDAEAVCRAMRHGLITAMVEEAANVRAYHDGAADLALWEAEMRRRSDA